jgi:hypothetical protein
MRVGAGLSGRMCPLYGRAEVAFVGVRVSPLVFGHVLFSFCSTPVPVAGSFFSEFVANFGLLCALVSG